MNSKIEVEKCVLLHEFVRRWNMLATFRQALRESSVKHAFYVDQLKHLNGYNSKGKNLKFISHRKK